MIVTIDGPAGAGKSTVARQLARRLGFDFLDTGAMYRAATLAALRRKVDLTSSTALQELVRQLRIELDGPSVLLDGEDVSSAIRQPEVGEHIHYVADDPVIRARLVELQRHTVRRGDFVSEGRDQGTVAFPDADCKIFLTASPEERARRRHAELSEKGIEISPEQVLQDQNERDRRDESRPVGSLQKAADAEELFTDGLSLPDVVDRLEQIVREKLRKSGAAR